jgi:multiple antibiotic resistance protein
MLSFNEYTQIFIGLFAILNPIGAIPLIILFTTDMKSERVRAGRMAALAVFTILLISLLIGNSVLGFFGISINSFRVAGGILLMLISIKMLMGKFGVAEGNEPDKAAADSSPLANAIVPLSTPLLAGPGSISAVILDADKGHDWEHVLVMSFIIALIGVVVWLVFLIAPWAERQLGKLGLNVVTRLMGLILASIAVEFIVNGVKVLFPGIS